MTPQSKKWSMAEAATQTFTSFFFSVLIQYLIFPLYGINVTLAANVSIVLIFMAFSLVRGYYVRRFFNWYQHRQRLIAEKTFRNI